MRDMERSSRTVRDDAKMERRTAGVTARCRFWPSTLLAVVVVVPASLTGALRIVGRGVSDDDEAISCLVSERAVGIGAALCSGFVLNFPPAPLQSSKLKSLHSR